MTRTRSISRTLSPSSPPPTNPSPRRSSRQASKPESIPTSFTSDLLSQCSQDICTQNTQCSNWSDEESGLDTDSKPKAKRRNKSINARTAKIEPEEINYGNLPLIDIWEAKGKGWTQDIVSKVPGFHKPSSSRRSFPISEQEGEYEDDNEIPISHVLCTGGPSSPIHIDPAELLACSLAPLPDDDDEEEGADLPPTTEEKQEHVIIGNVLESVAAVYAGAQIPGVYVCISQPLPDSEDEKL